MSIVPLVQVTLLAAAADREAVLESLQQLGVTHLDLAGAGSEASDSRIRRAIRYLAAGPRRRRPDRGGAARAGAIVSAVEALQQQRIALEEELVALKVRIAEVQPWGHFDFASLEGHPELRLWFYHVRPSEMRHVLACGHPWQIVGRRPGGRLVIVISADEPEGLPCRRAHVGARSLEALERRLGEIEIALDDLDAERANLSRWLALLERDANRLADADDRRRAQDAVAVQGAVAAVSGWAPERALPALRDWARTQGVALIARPPAPEEAPPTLLENTKIARAGEMLVRFFATPHYSAWDPSGLLLASFTLFFAIIVSDAVYGLLLGAAVALFWRRLGRSEAGRTLRRLALLLAVAAAAWGVAVGTYAGAAPPHPWLEALAVVPGEDRQIMMTGTLMLGVGHLVLANLCAARRRWPGRTAWAHVGWALVMTAGPLWYLAGGSGAGRLAAYGVAGAGLLLVLMFSSDAPTLGRRLVQGAAAMPRVVSVLGDVLSYLRLFALAIAGSSLGAAFNTLAAKVGSTPGTGVVFGLCILLVGHGINFILSIAGGVVHGLRLNYIEFFGWGLWGEGRPFLPFRTRESTR